MTDEPIRNLAKFRKLTESVAQMEAFGKAFPLLRPFLSVLGVDVAGITEALKELPSLATQIREFVELPDRFNEVFADRGWIMHDSFSTDVANAALNRVHEGDIDGAENLLVTYYDAVHVEREVMRLRRVIAFRSRMRLAELAATDYRDGRYYSSVLVVLTLMDGLVNDLHPNHRGLSAVGTQLDAWDSVAANSRGLGRLVAIFRQGRNRTREETITLPFRNGIVHGTDLGYDNVVVAAKTWAALFAVADWAQKVEHGEVVRRRTNPKSVSSRRCVTLLLRSSESALRSNNWRHGNRGTWFQGETSRPQVPQKNISLRVPSAALHRSSCYGAGETTVTSCLSSLR